MKRMDSRLGALSLAATCAVLLAACSAQEPPATSSAPGSESTSGSESAPSSESPSSATPSPSASASATPSATVPELSQSHEIHGISFMTPEGWTAKGDDCEGECAQWDEWEVKDESGKHVLTLIPTTATSPDGDMNLYEREILDREELPDPDMPGSKFHPASLIAEFYEATDQQDGEKDTGFTISLVDDEVLEQRTENPDLNFFKIGEQSPMFWVEEDYMEDFGVGDEPTQEQAQQFVDSEQYALVREILLSVAPAAS